MFIVTVKRGGLTVTVSKDISLPVTGPIGFSLKTTLTGYRGLTAYCPGPWILEPGSRTMDPRSGTLDPGSRTLDSGSRTLDPQSRTLDPRSRTLDPGSRTLDPRSRTLDPGFRILGPGSWIWHLALTAYQGSSSLPLTGALPLTARLTAPILLTAYRRGNYKHP